MAAATDNISVVVRVMKQKAVYWAPLDPGAFGKPTYDVPIEIDCRWEDVTEEFLNPTGEREMSRSKLMVDRDLELKGMMLLGELDSNVEANPRDNDGAWEIRLFGKTPNFKGNKFLREVYL